VLQVVSIEHFNVPPLPGGSLCFLPFGLLSPGPWSYKHEHRLLPFILGYVGGAFVVVAISLALYILVHPHLPAAETGRDVLTALRGFNDTIEAGPLDLLTNGEV
jgi:hypothetical protein